MVEGSGHVSVIDGGGRDTLLRFLSDRGIRRVDTIIVSHVDADHFGGISLLLSSTDFQVGQVFFNPDPRDTALWRDFVSVMIDAKQRGAKFKLELTNVNPGQLESGGVWLEVLAPSQELAYRTPDGRQLTPNLMSAVVRVWTDGEPRILVAGDIDQVGFHSLFERGADIRADVLVFPHHGGLPGRSDPTAFAESLVRAVSAQLVIFSIGRGRYGTPRPEIVSAVLRSKEGVHIACTQLSTHCAVLAEGIARNAPCAGTLEVSLEGDGAYAPTRRAHLEFIDQNAPTALCRGRGAPVPE